MWWRLAIAVAATGCGRIAFDPRGAHSTLDVTAQVGLLDFPLLVVLDDSRADRALMRPDASDLRFFDSAGQVLPYELEQVGVPGGPPLIAWVRLTAQSARVTVTYGDEPTATASDPVWSGDYVAVWHLSDASGALDSTTSHLDGIATGTTSAAGMIAGGRAFARTDPDWIAIPGGAGLALPNATISGWLFEPSDTAAYHAIVSREAGTAGNDDLWLGVSGNSVGGEFSTAASGDVSIGGAAVSAGRWLHLAATVDGATAVLFLDGASSGSHALVGGLLADPTPIFLGADRNGTTTPGIPDGDFVDGVLDEVRIEQVARSPAWIIADDLSQRDQLIRYGTILR